MMRIAPAADTRDEEVMPTVLVDPTVSSTRIACAPPAGLPSRRRRPRYDPEALPRPLDGRLVLLDDPSSARASSFRILRDRLVSRGLPRVAAVSSAVVGEGKTTCVVNLALAFAERPSARVLLVDANVFAPELGGLFRVETHRRVIEPDESLGPYAVVEIMESLHVCAIPWRGADPVPRAPQHRLDAIFARLSQESYDHVLLDTPAMRGTPATAPILSAAGGTLLVARSGTTTGRSLRRAAEQLPNERLGVALMDAAAAD
jgi:Mrp family chromosome partitioning ATPase